MSCVVYLSEISEFEDEGETEKLLSYVSDAKKQKLKRYRFPIDRKLSLYAELFVRQKAMEDPHITNDSITFSVNEYGKPYIQGYPDFQFNISHTHNALTVAFCDDEIGVDVERVKSVDLKISDRFFTSDEQAYIQHSENKDIAFCEIWTKKEAYIKYMGKGLSIPLTSFSVLDENVDSMVSSFQVQGYIVSVCCGRLKEEPIDMVVLTEKNIREKLNLLFSNDLL